jgi:hypothetical protein
MAHFELKIDESQLADVKAMVSGIAKGYETVMKNAINRTISTHSLPVRKYDVY